MADLSTQEALAVAKVSVVIPTTLREELPRAISSVLKQTFARNQIELVIVVDLALTESETAELRERLSLSKSDLLVSTGGGRGGGGARKIGSEIATGAWIAYLDDDDEWRPDKLLAQLTVALRPEIAGTPIVLSSRVVQRRAGGGEAGALVPQEVYRQDRSVARYLFHKRLPSVGRATMYTSTLMASRTVVQSIQWRPELKRHQDWDWLLRAAQSGAQVVQLEEPLVTIWTGSNGSISGSSDWKSSLLWTTGSGIHWEPEVLADFLAAQTLRYALHARSWSGIRQVTSAIQATKRLPSPSCVAIGLAGLVNRSMLERVLVRGRKTPDNKIHI
ncbi:hypothetical protein J2T10_000265 [Paenarthrobacter nicotinovorans]|uniref:Glycosyltransferase 2-like domain-containing protein n=1 Tax=Paenarthrobacter nicotinovorans TaxID=29320 RepID=A0ABT9THW1_PAENI|nr:hypothetical protein [Paenarthrobacter nicotinovorans]